MLAQYAKTADAFDSEKVNKKLKGINLGPNGSTVVIMNDGSFVEVTTTTRQVNDDNVPIEKNGFSTMGGYAEWYDMSGTRWVTEHSYNVGKIAFLKLNTYFKIGSKMEIYATDTSGTSGSIGVGVSSSAVVTANYAKIARSKGTYNLSIAGGGTQTYTIYTEVGFLNAFQEIINSKINYFSKILIE